MDIPWTSDISETEVLQSLEFYLDVIEISQYKLIDISLVSSGGEPINFAESDIADGGEVVIGWLPDEQKGMDLDFHYESDGPVSDSDPTDDILA